LFFLWKSTLSGKVTEKSNGGKTRVSMVLVLTGYIESVSYISIFTRSGSGEKSEKSEYMELDSRALQPFS